MSRWDKSHATKTQLKTFVCFALCSIAINALVMTVLVKIYPSKFKAQSLACPALHTAVCSFSHLIGQTSLLAYKPAPQDILHPTGAANHCADPSEVDVCICAAAADCVADQLFRSASGRSPAPPTSAKLPSLSCQGEAQATAVVVGEGEVPMGEAHDQETAIHRVSLNQIEPSRGFKHRLRNRCGLRVVRKKS